jgi:DNA-binding PadR family transcriptional regulator
MSGMYKKMWKMYSYGMDKYPLMFMKKMWKMWCHGMEKYIPMFMPERGMHPSMMPHKLAHKGIKIAILMVLQERPLSGYTITKHIEDTYGHLLILDKVYPTLQVLDDMGLITKTEQDNKKVYAITDDGKQLLQDHSTAVEWLEWMAKRPKSEFEHKHTC